jgi:hypothetical protein
MRTLIMSILVSGLVLVVPGGTASAHVTLTSPKPRTLDNKQAPCGASGSKRGTQVTKFAPGAKITVEWDETVDHPGHYRLAFDNDGDDVFANPSTPNDHFASTLMEPIADKAGGHYTQQITLPTAPCTNCTLQLIQVMTTSVPYDSFYYQCADITIGDGADDPADPMEADATGGCSTGGGGGTGALVIVAGVLVGWSRRRRG